MPGWLLPVMEDALSVLATLRCTKRPRVDRRETIGDHIEGEEGDDGSQ